MFERVATAVMYTLLHGAFGGAYIALVLWSFNNLPPVSAMWMVAFGTLISIPFMWAFGPLIAFMAGMIGMVAGLLAVMIRALIRWRRRTRQKNHPN